MTENFLLETISDNPYQPRTIDNAEHIENLARSIAADDLLQMPTARRAADGYAQLAFGHSRRKAFEWLRDNYERAGLPDRYNGYRYMPLNIAELSDEDMYRQAVSENVQRKDLDPIETAKAMLVYRDQFGKNSDEIGALFGMNGATVRGKLRLLDLPDTVQAKLQGGELSESAARYLITLSRLAPGDVAGALEAIVEDHEDPEEVVDGLLTLNKNVKVIREEAFSIKTKSFKRLPVLTDKELSKIDDEEKKAHLIAPPACTACTWYARVGGDDYCGLVHCFDRKSEAQAAANLEDASKKTGIAIYSEDDGEMVVMDRWEETHRKALDKKDADLRLMKAGKVQSYWHYINNDIPMNVALVAVGKLCEKYKKAKMQSEIDRGHIPTDADPKEKAKAIKVQVNEQIVRDEYDRIIFETIAPHFLPMLEPIKSEGLLELFADTLDVDNDLFDQSNESKQTGKARIKHLQTGIIAELWERESSWNARQKAYVAKLPVTELSKEARVMAEKWGVTLGKAFDQAVTDADARINEMRQAAIAAALADVSAETPAKKK